LSEKLNGLAVANTVMEWIESQDFPPPVSLGAPEARNSRIAWWEHEIDNWLLARPRRAIGKQAFAYRGPVDAAGAPAPRGGKPRKGFAKAADAVSKRKGARAAAAPNNASPLT
jgi:predicted DNA-binding transcriptional regulator AlpA